MRAMNGQGRRPPGWRGWATVALAIILVAFAFLMIGRNFRMEDGRSRARDLIAIDSTLGATLEPLDRTTARALGDGKSPYDMVVTSVATGGPADRAGIRVGDVIEAINGTPPGSIAASSAAIGTSPATILVNRHGKRVKIRIQVRSPESGE